MAYLHLNFFSQTGRGYDTDLPVFDGDCSQDRVDIVSPPTTLQTTPTATISADTKFVEVVTDTPVKLWCGSPSTSPEMKVSRAIVVGPGSRAISVLAGQTLHLWAAA